MDRDLLEAIRLVIREEIRVNDERLLTAEELAERLKVPKSWVYEQSRLGNIPTHLVGKYIEFRVSEVLKNLSKGGS